jgi:hypothetical protein
MKQENGELALNVVPAIKQQTTTKNQHQQLTTNNNRSYSFDLSVCVCACVCKKGKEESRRQTARQVGDCGVVVVILCDFL